MFLPALTASENFPSACVWRPLMFLNSKVSGAMGFT